MKYHFKHYKIIVFLLDLLLLFISFYSSYYFRLNEHPKNEDLILLILFILLCLIMFYILDLYNPWSHFSKFPIHYRSFFGIFVMMILYLIFSFIFTHKKNTFFESRSIFLLSVLLYSFIFVLSRFYFYKLIDPERLKIKWLVITNINYALEFQKEIDTRGGKWEIYYLLDAKNSNNLDSYSNLNIIGTLEKDFYEILKYNWTGIILGVKNLESNYVNQLLNLKRKNIPIYDLVYFYEYYFFKIPLYYIDDFWFLLSKGFMLIESHSIIRIKYIMDKILALILLVIFSPIMIIASIIILISDGFPIIFRQERLGQDKNKFIAYKFRTMIKDADKYHPYTLDNDPRIIKGGNFLRKSRIDELPQLFNVLKGDMSLIGPRAEWKKLTDKYEQQIKYYHFRHFVRPGLTGWAQVMYSYGSSIEDTIQKLEYDLYYIKNYSLLLDFLIILKTIRVILFGRGK